MKYYFNVKATELHDEELDIIEADNLDEARKIFSQNHPEDVDNVESISEENVFMPVWVK